MFISALVLEESNCFRKKDIIELEAKLLTLTFTVYIFILCITVCICVYTSLLVCIITHKINVYPTGYLVSCIPRTVAVNARQRKRVNNKTWRELSRMV